MTTRPADEAQALLPAMRVETGRIRDGVVEHAEVMEIPEEFFDAIRTAVLEQLTTARNATFRDYPRLAADSVVDRLVHDSIMRREDAARVRDLVELEIRRGIEHMYANARDRYASSLPVTLRLLITLITRRSGR